MAALNALNVTGQPPLVPADLFVTCGAIVQTGRTTVLVTFCIFLVFQRLPKLPSAELRSAEVDSFVSRIKGRHELAPDLLAALRAAALESSTT